MDSPPGAALGTDLALPAGEADAYPLASAFLSGPGRGFRWLHIRSHPGAGNTRLLQALAVEASQGPVAAGTRVLLVPGLDDAPGPLAPGLGPLGQVLYRIEEQQVLRGWRRTAARLRNTPRRRLAAAALRRAVLLPLAVLAVAYGNYLFAGVTTSFPTYVWQTLGPGVAIRALVVAVATNWLLGALVHDDLAGPAPWLPDAATLASYQLASGLAQHLRALAPTRLVLLVDDVHRWPRADLLFLRALASTTQQSLEVAALRAGRDIVVVTVDPTGAVDVGPVPEVLALAAPLRPRPPAADGAHLEAAARLVAGVAGAPQGTWGAPDLLGVCVADDAEARSEEAWLALLSTTDGPAGHNVLARHAAALHLLPPTDTRALLHGLVTAGLLTTDGRTLYRDRKLARAVAATLAREQPALLAQGHLFWYVHALQPGTVAAGGSAAHGVAADGAGTTGGTGRVADAPGAARHLMAAAALDDTALGGTALGGTALGSTALGDTALGGTAPGSTPLAAAGAHAAHVLLDACRRWRTEGDMARCRQALPVAAAVIQHAEAGAGADTSGSSALRTAWATEQALCYVVDLEHTPAPWLPAAAEEHAVQAILEADRTYRATGAEPQDIPDTGLVPALQNLNRVLRFWNAGEALGGSGVYSAPEFPLDVPAASAEADTSEYELLGAAVRRHIHTPDDAACEAALRTFQARLEATRPDEHALGLLATWHMGRAEYLSALEEWWAARLDAFGAEARAHADYQPLAATVAALCGQTTAGFEARLPVLAREHLEQCVLLGSVLGLRRVRLTAVETLARLLTRRPAAFHEGHPGWWLRWDRLFEVTIAEAEGVGSRVLAAFVRWHRWHFFRTLDARAAAWDALLFYDTIRTRRYPPALLLAWNQQITTLLTGLGLEPGAERLLAEVWLDRHRLLHDTGTATGQDVDLTSVEALALACQSFRLGGDAARARTTLLRAMDVLTTHAGPLTPLPAPDDDLLRLALFIFADECRQLHALGEGEELPEVSGRDLWLLVRPGDGFAMFCLRRVLPTDPAGWLAPWTTGMVDALNPHMHLAVPDASVPETSVPGADVPATGVPDAGAQEAGVPETGVPNTRAVAPPATTYEFVLRLVLGWVTGDSYLPPEHVAAAAEGRWARLTNPQSCLFAMAWAGLPIPDVPHLDALMRELLASLHHHYHVAEPNDEAEREALLLLMRYQPGEPRWRELYMEVVDELEALLERERHALRTGATLDALAILQQVHTFLSPLEDPQVVADLVEDAQVLVPLEAHRQALLESSAAHVANQQHDTAWQLLQEYLAAPDPPQPTFTHVRLLHTGSACADRLPGREREAQALRRRFEHQATRYVQRFASTIPEARGRQLAERVLDLLDAEPAPAAEG
ncbi:MAG: hypothetical protein AB7G23_19435 [Vicinamibacterales bacterium]